MIQLSITVRVDAYNAISYANKTRHIRTYIGLKVTL
jgi:hypothetical protein